MFFQISGLRFTVYYLPTLVDTIPTLLNISQEYMVLIYFIYNYIYMDTLPKTNIAPTNGWLEYYFPIGEAYFQGLR